MSVSTIIDSAWLFSSPIDISVSVKISFLNPDTSADDKILRDALKGRLELELSKTVNDRMGKIFDKHWDMAK